MADWLSEKGFTVVLSPGLVLLLKGEQQWDYPTLWAAFKAQGGPIHTFRYAKRASA